MPSPPWITARNALFLVPIILGGLISPLCAQEGDQPPPPEQPQDQPAEQDPPAPDEPDEAPAQAPTTPAQLGAIVEDAEADAQARLDAAHALIRRGALRESLVIVNAILGRTTGQSSGARVILEAMGDEPVVPGELWAPVALLPVADDASLRVLVATAAGSFRTRDAAALLVEWGERDPDPKVQRAARAALTRLSGRDLPPEPGVWDDWLAAQGTVDGLAWLRGLIQGLASRTDALSARLSAAERQLVETNRRLHLALPAEERSALLASLLVDPIPRLRTLGFDLVDRELASSVQLDESVGLAGIELLDNDDPGVRQRAALLVVRLAPERGAQAIIERLRRETDAGVAEALLRGVARWPGENCDSEVLRWALTNGPTSDAALDAAWSLQRSGMLTDEQARSALLDELRKRETGEMNASPLRLLSALGAQSDRARISALLDSGDAGVRRRAAEAIIADPESLDAIITAAQRDAGLYDLASRALGMHRRSAQGLAQLIALTPPTPEAGASAIDAMGALLSPSELLEATSRLDDPALRERLLARLLTEPKDPGLSEALIALAQARLDLGRAGDALAALDHIANTETPPPPPTQPLLDAKTTALLALGRVDEASELGGSPDAWLRGLELSIGAPHAPRVHEELTTRFAGALSDAQAARLSALRQLLTPAEPKPDPKPEPEPDPSDTGP